MICLTFSSLSKLNPKRRRVPRWHTKVIKKKKSQEQTITHQNANTDTSKFTTTQINTIHLVQIALYLIILETIQNRTLDGSNDNKHTSPTQHELKIAFNKFISTVLHTVDHNRRQLTSTMPPPVKNPVLHPDSRYRTGEHITTTREYLTTAATDSQQH